MIFNFFLVVAHVVWLGRQSVFLELCTYICLRLSRGSDTASVTELMDDNIPMLFESSLSKTERRLVPDHFTPAYRFLPDRFLRNSNLSLVLVAVVLH